MQKTENERMAILETTVNNLDKKVTEISTDVKAIIITLSKQPGLEAEILNLKNEIEDLKRGSNLWKWLGPTLTGIFTAVLSSIMTFLIVNYLAQGK